MSLDRIRLVISRNSLRRIDDLDDDEGVVLSASVKKRYMYLFSAFSSCLTLRLERSQSQ